MDTSKTRVLLLVGLVIGFAVVGAAVQLDSNESSTISDGVPLSSPDGTNIVVEGDTDAYLEDFVEDDSTVNVTVSEGIIEFSASGVANATIDKDDIVGTYTRVSLIDAAANDLTINPADKPPVTVGKDIDRIEFAEMALDDGSTDFIYAGTDGTTSKVTVNALPADTQVRAVDADTGAVLEGATTDGSGSATFDNLPNSEHTVVLQESEGGPSLSNPSPTNTIKTETPELSIDLSDPDFPSENVTLEWYVDGNLENTTTVTTSGTHTAEVGPISPDGDYSWSVEATDSVGNTDTQSATFTLDHYDPVIQNIKPSGDLDAEPSQIEALINDSDFGLDGDSLTANIYLDGSVIDSQSLNSNQTVTTSMPADGQTGGSHTIEFEVSDSYGQTVSQSVTYSVPDALFVRNETNHDQLVSVDGEVRFFPGDTVEGSEVFSRNASDGIINMTGLPVNEDFIVEVDPTDTNYTQRTIYIESIYEQQDAYVLNTSVYNTIESRFILNDPTGRYDSESVLKILRPIEINGSVEYQTIIGDQFGTEGVTAVLQEDTRYQLRVSSDSFEQAVGPYRADTSETVEVSPGTSSIELENPETWATGAAIDNTTIEFRYDDPAQATSKVVVYIHERGNESNQPVANQTFMDLGEASGQVTIPSDQADQEWVVEFVIDRGDESFVVKERLSNRKNLTPPLSSAWKGIVGVGMLVLLAGAFSVLNAAVGAVIVSLFGGLLYFIGFLGGATSGLAVAIAIFISVVGHVMSTTR